MAAWIGAHIHRYEYIEGVSAVTVPDNTKTAVTRPDYYEPLRKGGGLVDAPGRRLARVAIRPFESSIGSTRVEFFTL